MKYLLNGNRFKLDTKISKILEVLSDEILDPQKEVVSKVWGEKYLNYETISSTDKIEKGKFNLSEEDSNEIISEIFNTNISTIKKSLDNLSDGFKEDFKRSINLDMLEDNSNLESYYKKDKNEIDLNNLTFYDFACFYRKLYRKISLSESKSDTYIVRDENGKPLMDEDNKIIKKEKEPGEVIFTNNYTNLSTFYDDWNKIKDITGDNIFQYHEFKNIYSIFLDNPRIGNFNILDSHKIYLYISDNPKDILNMSVSPFFTSCQELYKGGGHGTQYMKTLLGNVFDPNSVPAFIIIDTPYIEDGKYLSDFISLSRLIIRNIDDEEDDSSVLFFDKTYPGRMEGITESTIKKYTSNEERGNMDSVYIFKPALDTCDFETIQSPYMDNLGMKTKKTINMNTKKIIIDSDISEFNIGEINKKLESVVIKTSKLPKNFFKVKLSVDYLKFEFMSVFNLNDFKNIDADSFIFEKCNFTDFKWDSLKESNVKELSFRSIEVKREDFPLEVLNSGKIEKLELIYSFTILPIGLLDSSIKELKVSGDILNNKDNREILKKLKHKGVEIKKVGLVL